MPAGGQRYGRQGEAYSNRTDLNQTALRTGSLGAMPGAARPYGTADTGSLPPGPSAGQDGPPGPPAPSPSPDADVAPGGLMPLNAPSQRPSEPLLAGAPGTEGPGGGTLLPDDPNAILRHLYAVYPHPDILRLMERG